MFKMFAKGGAAVIDITDLIGMGGFYADDMRAQLNVAKNVKNITCRITSDGGDVNQGLAIYSMLRAHPAKVRIEIAGVAASMGSVIAMAGDEIAMCEDSFMMIHNPASMADGEADELRERADLLDKTRDMLVNIYARRTGLKPDAIAAAMAAETWMTAREALALGYCTEIIPAKNVAARVRRFNKTPKALQRAQEQGQKMDPELLKKLGLADDATLEDVLAAIDALQTKAAEPDDDDAPPPDDDDAPTDADDEDDDAPEPAPKNETATARAKREARNAIRARRGSVVLSAIKALSKEIKGIGERVDGSERESLMRANAKKFTPALEKKARKWPMSVLRDFIETADDLPDSDDEPEVTERGASRVVAKNKGGEATLTTAEKEYCRITGQAESELLAFKKNGLRLVKKGA
jgi:ATP-dependent protease ClpP protease subunit